MKRSALEPVPVVELPATLARALENGHPWIYRDHVPAGFAAPTGAWVEVRAGSFSGHALWDADSPLALRVFSRRAVPDERWIGRRVQSALALREALGIPSRSSAYRWIAGEGDGLPGLVVDRYGAFAVLTTDSPALSPLVPWIVARLRREGGIAGVVRKWRDPDGGGHIELLGGRKPPKELLVEEYGLKFHVDLEHGQKTGLFLDQRENRRTIESIVAGRRVLNLFGYTGGFSIYAARGGATHVTTVDLAAGAMATARRNFAANGFDPEAHDFVVGDAFEYLRLARERGERFDLVVCDPPSFARSRAHRDRALKAYVRLHVAALSVTAPDGLYAASSCTTQVGVEAFRETLAIAASKCRLGLQVVHDAGHAPDHPVLAGHPEGRYLKFLLCQLLPNE